MQGRGWVAVLRFPGPNDVAAAFATKGDFVGLSHIIGPKFLTGAPRRKQPEINTRSKGFLPPCSDAF